MKVGSGWDAVSLCPVDALRLLTECFYATSDLLLHPSCPAHPLPFMHVVCMWSYPGQLCSVASNMLPVINHPRTGSAVACLQACCAAAEQQIQHCRPTRPCS